MIFTTGCASSTPYVNQAVEKGKDLTASLLSSGSLEVDIYSYAKQVITEQLECPSTAVFPMYEDSFVQIKNGMYIVSAYVDAQNLAGAMVRSEFSVAFSFEDGGKCRYTILSMN